MAALTDVVEFHLGDEHYALDIQIAREIVEMMPITKVPKAPEYIAGIINLRGEITTIINLNGLLGIPEKKTESARKIIVMMPEAAGNRNMGVIVDDVHSVIQVSDSEVEKMGDDFSSGIHSFVKGIIKPIDAQTGKIDRLIIWVDIEKVISDMIEYH